MSDDQIKNKQKATIVSIEDHNKSFEVKIIDYQIDDFSLALDGDGDRNVLLALHKGNFGEYFEVGDEIEFKKHSNHDFKIINMTCDVLRLSRFKRDLISILRRLDDDDHPLKRCILLNEPGFILLSAKKNKEKLILFQNQLDN